MPDFLEEFASSINLRKEVLREKILKGKPNPLNNDFEKHFESHWVTLDSLAKYSVSPRDLDIIAVDSSVYTNLMSTGGIFYVVRSLALCRNHEQKLLETDILFTKASFLESERFIVRKMELLEIQVAIDALKSGFECGTILIDGSLYGRTSHIPIETEIEDQRLTLLEYFQCYRRLFEMCKEKGIMLVGVSKESRSTFYRDYVLKLIFSEAVASLNSDMDPADLQKLKPIFVEMVDSEGGAISKFAELQQKYGKKLGKFELIFDELRSSRPDYQLIMNHAKAPGYTKPLLLGPSIRMTRRLNQCWRDPAKYVRTHFPVTAREKGKDFVKWASNIITDLRNFPGIISLYIMLDPRDSPIRIDLPSWDHTFAKTGWPILINVNMDELLKVMVTGYCGLDCHNLWLKNVDERVRLKRSVVDAIYFPFIERLFDAKIIRGRGYRRVRFP